MVEVLGLYSFNYDPPSPISKTSFSDIVLGEPFEGSLVEVPILSCLLRRDILIDSIWIFGSNSNLGNLCSRDFPYIRPSSLDHLGEINQSLSNLELILRMVLFKLHKAVIVGNTEHISMIIKFSIFERLVLPLMKKFLKIICGSLSCKRYQWNDFFTLINHFVLEFFDLGLSDLRILRMDEAAFEWGIQTTLLWWIHLF